MRIRIQEENILKKQKKCKKIGNNCIVADHGLQTIAAGGAWTHGPRITRKASWPLAQKGALFLINPGMVFAIPIPLFKAYLLLLAIT